MTISFPQLVDLFKANLGGIIDARCWPEMLKVHYRDSGSWFSIIQAKYYIRKAVGPFWYPHMRMRLRKESK